MSHASKSTKRISLDKLFDDLTQPAASDVDLALNSRRRNQLELKNNDQDDFCIDEAVVDLKTNLSRPKTKTTSKYDVDEILGGSFNEQTCENNTSPELVSTRTRKDTRMRSSPSRQDLFCIQEADEKEFTMSAM